MKMLIFAACILLSFSKLAAGQESSTHAVPVLVGATDSKARKVAEFEAVSIRPSHESATVDPVSRDLLKALANQSAHGRFSIQGIPVTLLVELAYGVVGSDIVGLPAWASTQSFDINATAGSDVSFEVMRPMLQSMLTDRFSLSLHNEMRQSAAYALIATRSGFRKSSLVSEPCFAMSNTDAGSARDEPRLPSRGTKLCGGIRRQTVVTENGQVEHLEGFQITMRQLVELLSEEVGRPVRDETGVREKFDVNLRFAALEPSVTPVSGERSAASSDGKDVASLRNALKETMGLELVVVKATSSVLVVDHIDRPSAN